MPSWLAIALGLLAGAMPGFVWIRRQEKRIDLLWVFAFGVDGANGTKRTVADLQVWKEESRAQLPERLRAVKHDAVDELSPYISGLGARVDAVEDRLTVVEVSRKKGTRG